MAYLTPSPKMQFFTANGIPLVGGKLYTYEAGTTTPLATYVDQTGSSSNPNPIILDSRGEANVWLGNAVLYDFVLKDSTDVLIWTGTNVGNAGSNPLASTFQVQNFSGDGTTVAFTLTYEPPNENNTQVYINGAYQQKNTYSVAATTITFSSAPPLGTDNIEVMTIATLSFGYIDSSLVNYVPLGAGAVPTTVQNVLRQTVSIKDFGAVGDGSDEYAEILAAWTYCVANGFDLYFPAGIYSSGVNNMPFKHGTYPAVDLLDCKNITIYGDGPNTVLRSDSAVGADVLNLYSVKNLHVRQMKVTANLSGSAGAGSNGVSIVGGFDNITLDHIWCEDLPYVDKASYLDGGKAFTIQPGTPATECGTIQGTNLFAKGCVYGVGLEVDLVNWGTKKHAIDMDVVAEDCHIGVIFSADGATSALSPAMTMGYNVTSRLINCQRNIVIGRAHGCAIEANIITTKSIAARRLNPAGGVWNTVDSVVDGLLATYAKNSRLVVFGDMGDCDYKAQIGGTTAGSSGQGGQTDNCQIYVDLGGTAVTADINAVNSGGNIATNTTLFVTTTTTAVALPTLLYDPTYANTLTKGPARMVAPIFAGAVSFAYTDGITSYNFLERDSLGMFFKQTGGSSADIQVLGVKSHAGAKLFAIRNDGYIATDGRGVASAVATVKGVLPIYDAANVLVGYTPIYTSYTP